VQAPPAQTPQAQTPSTQMQPAPRPRAAAGTGGIHDHLHYVVYDNEVRVEGSRAWRTNNPGNLEYHQFARDHGAIGPDGRNAVFPDEQTGAEAIAALLQTNTYQLLTIREAITRYAPPDENDTEDYINTIRRQTGLDPNTRMSSLTPNQLMSVVRTIRVVEGWRPGQVYTCANSNTPALTWIHDLLGCVP